MSETSSRLLKLLSLLQARKEWSGTELAERLEVTTRTVRNDVERLRSMGYPVNATRGSEGGYQLGAGAELPPLLFDDEEAVAVAIGLRNAAAGAIEGIEESSLRALAKLEQILPSRLRRHVAALQNFTVPVPMAQHDRIDATTLTLIAAACRDHEQLRFDYKSRDDEATRRTVEPYRLVNWGRRWYLVAWDTRREDWRTFRVDRMKTQTPAGPRFTPRALPNEDIAAYLTHGITKGAWKVRARVLVHTSAEELSQRIGPWVGTVEAIDEQRCILDCGGSDVEDIASHLGLLQEDFEIQEPPELIDAVRAVAERYRRATG
jgi:predicted DNA-binding transcriptional regulator YafY